jgi:hypothetical protein
METFRIFQPYDERREPKQPETFQAREWTHDLCSCCDECKECEFEIAFCEGNRTKARIKLFFSKFSWRYVAGRVICVIWVRLLVKAAVRAFALQHYEQKPVSNGKLRYFSSFLDVLMFAERKVRTSFKKGSIVGDYCTTLCLPFCAAIQMSKEIRDTSSLI